MTEVNGEVDDSVLVEAQGVGKAYVTQAGSVPALEGVNLAVKAGELVALVGPTGSGKTTLLNLLAGLETPDAGEVVLAGEALGRLNEDGRADRRARLVGMVFQRFNLFPGFTVLENVGLPLRLMRRPPFDAHRRAQELLEQFGLAELAARYPGELSQGQRQLVAVARALAANPPLILADEPTANLDSQAARAILSRLRGLVADGAHGVLLATHDVRAASHADRVLSLRDGRIVKETVLEDGRDSRSVLAELV